MKFSLRPMAVLVGMFFLNHPIFAQCPTDSVPDMRYDAGNGDFAYIDNVSINGNSLSLTSGFQTTPPSYQQHFSSYAEMEINTPYALSGYIPFLLQNVFVMAWIDGNNDGFYTNDELVGFQDNISSPFFNFGIQTPVGSVRDTVAMRVTVFSYFNAGGPGSTDACGLAYQTVGETEDYKVIIKCRDLSQTYSDFFTYCYNDSIEIAYVPNYGEMHWYTDTLQASVSDNFNYYFHPSSNSDHTEQYYFQVTEEGCSSPFYTMHPMILEGPVVEIFEGDSIFSCGPIVLHATPGFDNYNWTTGSDFVDSCVINSAMNNMISVSVDGINGCQDEAIIHVVTPGSSNDDLVYILDSADFCTTPSVYLNYNAEINPGTVQWFSVEDNAIIGNTAMTSYALNTPGDYHFIAYLNTACGLDTVYKTFTYHPMPSYSWFGPLNAHVEGNGDTIGCFKDNMGQIAITMVSGMIDYWAIRPASLGSSYYPNYSTDDTLEMPSSMVGNHNEFYAFVLLYNQHGCQVISDTIHFFSGNTMTSNYDEVVNVCSFPALIFGNADYALVDVLWSTGDTVSSITVNTPGNYWYTVDDAQFGCHDSVFFTVQNSPAPTDVIGDTTATCSGVYSFESETMLIYGTPTWYLLDDNLNPIGMSNDTYFIFNDQQASFLVIEGNNASGCTVMDTTFLDWNGTFEFDLGPDVTTSASSYTIQGPIGMMNYSWNPNPTPGNSLTVTQSGTYSLACDNFGGCSYFDEITITFVLGTEETQAVPMVHVFPNPGNGMIRISSEEQITSLQIVDLAGRQVFNANDKSGITETSINLSTYPNGVYFIQVETSQGKQTIKYILQH